MKKDIKKSKIIEELTKEDKKDELEILKLDKMENEPIIEEVKIKKHRLKRVILRKNDLVNTKKGLLNLYKAKMHVKKKYHKSPEQQKQKNLNTIQEKKLQNKLNPEKTLEEEIQEIEKAQKAQNPFQNENLKKNKIEKPELQNFQKNAKKEKEITDEEFVKKMLFNVKSWSNKLMPRYDFRYLLERIRKLGKESEITGFMSKLRAVHIGEITEEELKDMYKTEAENLENIQSQNFNNFGGNGKKKEHLKKMKVFKEKGNIGDGDLYNLRAKPFKN